MPQLSQLQRVRSTVMCCFQTQDAELQISELTETILVRDGCYCGRRFECGGMTAVWFIEEGEIKVYQHDGQSHQRLNVDATPRLPAKAA